MDMPVVRDQRLNTLHTALTGLARRQQALASNVANVDTPNYQRQDAKFEDAMRGQLMLGSTRLRTTAAGHIPIAPHRMGLLDLARNQADDAEHTARNDNNDVDIDYEMTRIAETTLRYQLLTEATASRFMTLRDVVTRAV